MFNIFAYVRYSNTLIFHDLIFILGALIFFLLCGILIFQNKIWEEEEYSTNNKGYKWKTSTIKENKADLIGIYPTSKKEFLNISFH